MTSTDMPHTIPQVQDRDKHLLFGSYKHKVTDLCGSRETMEANNKLALKEKETKMLI